MIYSRTREEIHFFYIKKAVSEPKFISEKYLQYWFLLTQFIYFFGIQYMFSLALTRINVYCILIKQNSLSYIL